MKLNELKQKIVGKKLMTIITLEPSTEINAILKVITGNNYGESVDSIKLLVFENEVQLLYTDYDSDGYRSGEWYLHILQDVLDKGATTEIKNINSTVRDILFMEDIHNQDYYMITTDEYIIMMGQDLSDSYYPQNFFNIEETKQKAIEEAKANKYKAERIEE